MKKAQALTEFNNPLPAARSLARFGSYARFMRSQLFAALESVTYGQLVIEEGFEGGERFRFGPADAELRARITINDPACYAQIALGGDIGAGESYMDGLWDAEDLEQVIRVFVGDDQLLERMEGRLSGLTRPLYRRLHSRRANSKDQARRNISAHYDLGNAFYSAWLDPSMMYSCAVFPDAEATLEQAQYLKLDMLLDSLEIQPGQRLLEIGTGWGSLAIRAAEKYGAMVTTTTISAEQARYAREAVSARGLDDRITVLEHDYRDLEGRFDHVVSVEMIEAVGHEYFDTYFRQLDRLLTPQGRAAIQAITMVDQNYEQYRRSTDFINQYIFPGGCLPSITALQDAATRNSSLRLARLQDIGLHYARTLREWRQNLAANLDRLPEENREPSFLRMWDYYLMSCAGAFAERRISTVQLLYTKRQADVEALD